MFSNLRAVALVSALTAGLASPVYANLILETYDSGVATPSSIGGYTLTDFDVNHGSGGSTSTVVSPIGGELTFVDSSDTVLELNKNLADSTYWWNNGEYDDYDIFTTDENLITILLPENTYAFSFTVGANVGSTGNNAWLIATETDGTGIDTHYDFNVNRNNTPSFGIYALNDGSCSMLSSVTIEPDYWGVGNFSINQGSCTASVPEPSSFALLGLGVLGFGIARKRSLI